MVLFLYLCDCCLVSFELLVLFVVKFVVVVNCVVEVLVFGDLV